MQAVMAYPPMPASGFSIGGGGCGGGSTGSCAPAPPARSSTCSIMTPAPSPVPPFPPMLQRANSSTRILFESAARKTQMPTLVLPAGTEIVGLVGEGLANTVFSFSLPRVGLPVDERSTFRGKLLRLQKAPRDGRANQYPYTEVQRYWESEVRPLFRDPDACLVRQQLVVVRREVSAACNRLLAEAEADGDRDDKFVGDFVREGPQLAMIVDDMRPPPRSLDMMGEFKPKWLTQSPSAPQGSVRCRTCATYLRRFILKPSASSLSGFQRACRLRLCDESLSPPPTPVNEDPPVVPPPPQHDEKPPTHSRLRRDAPPLKRAATFPAAIPRVSNTTSDTRAIWSKEALLSSIRAHPLMRELCLLQARLDTRGPLVASPDDADFQKAMTLRDCTCYIYVSRSRAGATSISARLGDLDRKDGAAKSDYWLRTEQTLIESGFYTARTIRVGGDEYEVPIKCALGAGPDRCGRQVMEVVRAAGPSITILGTNGGGDALLGVRDPGVLQRELESLRPDEGNHRKRKLEGGEVVV